MHYVEANLDLTEWRTCISSFVRFFQSAAIVPTVNYAGHFTSLELQFG